MIDFSIGRWMVVPGFDGVLTADAREVIATTEKLAKFTTYGTRFRQVSKSDVIATFETQQEAEQLCQTLRGIKGERDRRIQAAHLAAKKQADDLIAAARQESAS